MTTAWLLTIQASRVGSKSFSQSSSEGAHSSWTPAASGEASQTTGGPMIAGSSSLGRNASGHVRGLPAMVGQYWSSFYSRFWVTGVSACSGRNRKRLCVPRRASR
jgi:hypothetical protein